MNTLAFYLGALALFGLGALCLWNTSVLTHSGGPEFLAKRRRRIAGILVMMVAATALITALISQFSSGGALPSSAATASTAAGSATASPLLRPLATAATVSSIVPPSRPPLAQTNADQPKSPPVAALLGYATQLLRQDRYQPALYEVNAALKADPKNPAAYALRGNIFASKKLWSQAEADYETAIQLDGANLPMKFDLGQLEFAQKKYTAARPLFVAVQSDPDIGDLATYEVFLCDLFGGHEDVAAKELDVFNQAGSHASYYFANAAWALAHHDKDKARDWLTSAGHIYAPYKFKLYADNLIGIAEAPPAHPPAQ
jgi:tetratricopeptide (TPR) repeat protein